MQSDGYYMQKDSICFFIWWHLEPFCFHPPLNVNITIYIVYGVKKWLSPWYNCLWPMSRCMRKTVLSHFMRHLKLGQLYF